ncbi:MAG: hypothetical protein ACLP1X_14895 [Polyangiaceae bacterium]
MARGTHRWKFFRAGGVDQVVLADGADLANLHTLDQKLWVALACPTKGLEFDARTLALLDTDHDGRIRPPEILAAIAWTEQVLSDLGVLFDPSEAVPLASIGTKSDAGRQVLAGAKLVLSNLGKADATEISLADVSDTAKIFVETKFNGDGVVPADSADDEEARKAIEDVVATLGSVPDRSGKPGVDQARVTAFFDQARLLADWVEAGRAPGSPRVLGDATDAAAAALSAVRAKVDDCFARCRLAAFDPRAAAALNPSEADLLLLGTQLLSAQSDEAAKLPLCRVEASRPLPLREGVNPAWAERMTTFVDATVVPILGGARASLTEADWRAIKEKLAPFDAWLAARPATEVGKLGDERVLALARSEARGKIDALLAKDAALATESNQIESIERLIRYRHDLVPLLKNFVNFADFYGKRRGIFQVGTLYLDGRSCDLCIGVEDGGRHALLAGLSEAYLAYCDCVRRSDPAEKRSIVAAFTGGDTDNLMAGRNGVFYDRAGADWDATITKIVENPISIRQAFWAPYKRFVRLIEEQVQKRAAAADAESKQAMDHAAAEAASADKASPEPAAKEKPEKKGIDVGTVAAIGVAVGGIATFLTVLVSKFVDLGIWMPVGVLVIMLAVSGPSMLIAWLKLRRRNIGPLLDANGWAVNALARINLPFGEALTGVASLPKGTSRSLRDPFAEKKRPWRFYAFVLLVLGLGVTWFVGQLDAYLPDKARAAAVLHRTHEVVPLPPAPAESK